MNRLDPTRALLHPLWWSALALLVVNDHLLKGAGVLPAALTGKLSDLAGLLVAPWLLAFLLRVTTTRGVLYAHALVGAGFAGINLWPQLARVVEVTSSYTPFPWHITVDASDVLALPALAVSFLALGAVARSEVLLPRASLVRGGQAVSLATGLLACVATSPPPVGGGFFGSIFLVSAAPDSRVVTTRALRLDVVLDCDFVAEDPTNRLSQDLFTPVTSWQLEPGDVVPFTQSRLGCDAVLLGGGGAPPALVFWRDGELPPENQFPRETLQESGERSIFLEDQDVGPRFSDHPLRYGAPPLQLPRPAEGCEVPAKGGVVWSEQVPEGSFVLDDLLRAPDGCYALDLLADDDGQRFFLCLDGEELPFSVGELLTIDETRAPEGRTLVVSGEALVLTISRGATLAGESESSVPVATAGCTASFGACGSVLMPATVVVQDGANERALEVGAATPLSSGTRLYLASAVVAPVRDPLCDATAVYLESFSLAEKE